MLRCKRALAPVATTLLSALLVPISAGPADAATPVKISGAQYDSPGSDGGSNRSLNAEWVRITNNGRRARTLTGWTLRDQAHHVYRFGTFRLGAGKSVVIHTGSGRNTAAHRYWGSDWYIWNNDGDRAVLNNKRGTTVSTRSW
jgi:hypothetical protein